MNQEFESVINGIRSLISMWEPILEKLQPEVITCRKNKQNRTIKQIVGHMIDSASNNTHRMVHLQYQPSPFEFPNYASMGNNDRWIAIQQYQFENWEQLIGLWKFANLHVAHVIAHLDQSKLNNHWVAAPGELVCLRHMATDYLRHLQLHLNEIKELMD